MPEARLVPAAHTFVVGDRVTMTMNSRRYIGTVADSTHLSGFDVIWDHGQGRGRFVHGGEPDTLRHVRQGDTDDQLGALQRTARVAELRELLGHHPEWPQHVLDALRLRIRTITTT